MTIKVILDKKGQIFIRGLRDRIRTDVPEQAIGMARILKTSIRREIIGFAKNPTGALADSFNARVRTSPSGNITASMESDLPYALIHEVGGPAGRNLAAFIRPKRYLTKALEKAAPKLQKLTTKTLTTVVRKAASKAG